MNNSVVNHFAQIPQANVPRSRFARPHSLKTTVDSGYLVPIYCDEVLPGDTHTVDVSSFGRLATPITPFMDNIQQEVFFFFVPSRLVWDNWEKLNGERKNPNDSIDYLVPQVTNLVEGVNKGINGSLWDYFGLPIVGSTAEVGIDTSIYVNALPFRAYNLIWNEWFRDENLQDSVDVPLGDDVENLSKFQLLKRGKKHDYFTSALPWPQKGPGVELPLGTVAPIALYSVQGTTPSVDNVSGKQLDFVAGDMWSPDFYWRGYNSDSDAQQQFKGTVGASWGATGSAILGADLTQATAATINSLREAFQIQGLLERDAIGGSRYTEILRSHFGVISPDARLQRPEFLGGYSQPVIINPVVQQSATDSVTPQGNLAGYGVVGAQKHGFTKSFTEHGYIIGLVNFRADLSYQQGINRLWSRRTRYDFYWPALAHLGEQALLNKELYCGHSTAVSPDDFYNENTENNDVFGYQERYSEYRYKPSMITGKMRSWNGDDELTAEEGKFESIDYWHLAQNFGALPRLNDEFIAENPPLDRVVAVPSEPEFLLDCFFNVVSVRPIPVYSTPALLSRF